MIKYIITRVAVLTGLCALLLFLAISILDTTGHTVAAYSTMSKSKLKKFAKATNPLKSVTGRNYCSSSHIKYKSKVYTVTNKHCCEAYSGFEADTVRVGSSLERILHISNVHDVCVLSASNVKGYLKLANYDIELWDSIMLMGYPLGLSLTPSAGIIISINTPVIVGSILDYTEYISHEAMLRSFPGNSGSPVVNRKGQVVGLLYAGYRDINRSIIVPWRYVKDALKEASK